MRGVLLSSVLYSELYRTMHTLIRIRNISESTAKELADEFNRLIPGFCEGTGKHLLESDLYSFTISTEDKWLSHQKEIIDVLSKLGNSLLQVIHPGVEWSLNPCFHMCDYRGVFFIDYDFSHDLLQIIAKFGGYLEVSFFPHDPCLECSTCPENLTDAKTTES